MFWSSATLYDRLPNLISDFDKDRVGRSNYTLRIGPEAYISPTRKPDGATDQTKIKLEPGDDFRIPAGQFAFLLTEETIKVPQDALAFISIRAGYKFRGLVNVSGFHVDPEFEGRLIFAVFNAGPSAISMERGEDCFHIWYASLDNKTELGVRKGYDHIPAEVIDKLGEQLLSFDGLKSKIDTAEERLAKRIAKVETEQSVTKYAAAAAIAIFGAFVLNQCSMSGVGVTPTSSERTQPEDASKSSEETAPAPKQEKPTSSESSS